MDIERNSIVEVFGQDVGVKVILDAEDQGQRFRVDGSGGSDGVSGINGIEPRNHSTFGVLVPIWR